MFREAERLPIVQDMILANDTEGRKRALAKLLPFQQGDFREMYEAMDGPPVLIRLSDPPLHEFLREYADVDIHIAVARATGQNGADLQDKERIYRRLEQIHEDNPMLGLRGCRLLLVYPEILEMQIRAILGAAADSAEAGVSAKPEIMMPLVGTMGELDRLRDQVMSVAAAVEKDRGRVGEMMKMGLDRGRKTKPDLKIGICGEHAGEPSSVAFCHEIGLTYVSPSTYRVPVARLAAAQAALATKERDR